jgi:hypothetical protein
MVWEYAGEAGALDDAIENGFAAALLEMLKPRP